MKKYLEPVLKKCGLDKPRQRQPSRDGPSLEVEEGGGGSHRPRSDSVTENMSESEGDTTHTATPSTASTPHTPPTQPRKSSISSDLFPAPVMHYPFSSLNLLGLGMSRTPSESSPSVQGTCTGSPSVTTPCTPSSIDSGISLRHHSSSILSPVDVGKSKKSFTYLSSSSSHPLPPLPPPEENAPPLPPPQDSVMPPPPLPPLPPAPSEEVRVAGNDCGIENISSDEEEESISKPPLPPVRNGKVSSSIKPVDAISPVSLSPTSSSPRQIGASKAVNGAHHVFDPSLGLRTLLAAKASAMSSSNSSSTVPHSGATPSATSSLVTSSTTATAVRTSQDQSKSFPYVGSSSPCPVSSAYELEVEEISGDESPVMVCFEPLKVETISDDDMELSGDDMEVCSDDENAQDNVIEVNVKTSQPPMIPTFAPRGHPPGLPRPPFPPDMRPDHPPPPPPPLGFFPPHPPGAPFPPPPHLHPPPGPPGRPDFEFISPPHHPPLPPHMMLHPPHEPVRPRLTYHNSPPSFINDVPISRLPNGYIGRHPPSRSFSKSKMLKGFSSPKNKREGISQDVLYKAMEQLRLILLNDVHKKIVENSAYPVLDSHWEKREKEVQCTCMCVGPL